MNLSDPRGAGDQKNNNEAIYKICMKCSEIFDVVPDYDFKNENLSDPIVFAKLIFLGSRLFETLIAMNCNYNNATTFLCAFENKFYRRIHQFMQLFLKGLNLNMTRLRLLKEVSNGRELVVSVKDVVLGTILESKGSQFFSSYKHKMSFIVEKFQTQYLYAQDEFIDEKRAINYINYAKSSVFELIKEVITSLNFGNLYLIDRVNYPTKSDYNLSDTNETCITVTSKESFLAHFIDHYEGLIRGIQNIIVGFVLSKNWVGAPKPINHRDRQKEERMTLVREKLLEYGFPADHIEIAFS